MNRFKHLRLRIADLASSINLKDDYAIEGICQLLNIKYPLEELKTFEYRLFGRTHDEILKALEFYDKHSEQAVKDDLTLSEAVEKAYAIQKEYASGVDKKWVEVQLKSYEAIGLIKFKKENNKIKNNTLLEAEEFATEYLVYDPKNPANIISQMSRMIRRLINIIKDQ